MTGRTPSGWDPCGSGSTQTLLGRRSIEARLRRCRAHQGRAGRNGYVPRRGTSMTKLDSPLVVDRSPTLSDDQWRRLLQIRASDPGAVAEAYAARRRPDRVLS